MEQLRKRTVLIFGTAPVQDSFCSMRLLYLLIESR